MIAGEKEEEEEEEILYLQLRFQKMYRISIYVEMREDYLCVFCYLIELNVGVCMCLYTLQPDFNASIYNTYVNSLAARLVI